MKHLFKILIFLLGFSSAFAQNNPFAELGYNPKIATLSNGQFIESFDNDTIVQIGSVLFNTKSQQIVAFVKTDTLYSEATLEPDIVSRWMSPDPLAAHPTQIGLTPYHFAGNTPILWNDPDGRCPWCLVWVAVEVGFAIYDAYDAYQTITDDDLSAGQKTAIVGASLGSSLILPGGGYGAAGKKIVKEVATESGEHLVKSKGDDLVKKADEMVASFKKKQQPNLTKSTAHQVAQVGENHLKSLGGKSQVKFTTSKGGRVVDQLVKGTAYEAKTGYKSLTKDITEQIAKDVELLKTNKVKEVVWNFYKSPATGKAGASKPLQEALKNAGIKTQIIK